MIRKWRVLDSRIDKDYSIFRVRAERARSPRTQGVNDFYTLECGNWVNVVPLTEDRHVVMIRQYRHGSRRITLEIPGGAIDEADPAEAARRELAEETGYEAASMIPLGAVNPNPAIFNNLCYTYLAENVVATRPLALDPTEDIEVELVALDRIPSLIASGTIDHGLVVVAFHLYLQKYGRG
ncbi:MAG: NUDIX hydrolase [Syntrophorhabdales bacterium]|jgi:8-oxo-dGTP pyrophosphatase MutT (NUDIX family)